MNAVVTMQPEALPEATSISLSLPDTMTFEEWEAVGAELANRAKKLNWWIGDWWAAGHHRYGDRARLAARGLFGKEFKTLANIASVCRAFEPDRRREQLSWSHHAEAAALSPNAADMLLDLAERDKMSKAQVRAAVTTIRGGPVARSASVELAGLYRAYNRLSPALRTEAARAFAALAATGAEIDPDTGRVRAEPEPESAAPPVPEAAAPAEGESIAAAEAILDHDAIAVWDLPEDAAEQDGAEEEDVLDLVLDAAAFGEAPSNEAADHMIIPPAADDWDAPDTFAPGAPTASTASDLSMPGALAEVESLAVRTGVGTAGASEAVLVLDSTGLPDDPPASTGEATEAPAAGASEAVLDLEALGVPLPDHAPEPVLDLASLQDADDVLDLGEVPQAKPEPSPSR